jgi:hypothetical protein
MWKEAALATAVFAAAPQFLHAPARVAAAAPSAGKTFAPTCRDGQVLDSRPDPAWVSRSFDRDNCREPAMPAALDGAKASRPDVVAAMISAKAYAVSAGAFQKCVVGFVAAKRAGVRPLAPSDLIIENHRVLLSQRSAERAQAQARAAVVAFNAYGSGCDDP